jgi:hypothetical protein
MWQPSSKWWPPPSLVEAIRHHGTVTYRKQKLTCGREAERLELMDENQAYWLEHNDRQCKWCASCERPLARTRDRAKIDVAGLHPIPFRGCPLPHRRCCTERMPFRVVAGYGQGTASPIRFPQRGSASSRNPLNTRNKVFNLFTTPINPSRLVFGIVLLQTSRHSALTPKPTQ